MDKKIYMGKIPVIELNRRFAGFIAGSLILGGVLGVGTARYSKNNNIDNCISNDMTFNDVLSSVSSETETDEILSAMGYEDVLARYVAARKKSDSKVMYNELKELSNMILESSICDLLEIEPNDLIECNFKLKINNESKVNEEALYQVYCDITYYTHPKEIVPGNIEVQSNKLNKETYELTGEARNLFLKSLNPKKSQAILEELDGLFLKLESFPLTEGNITDNKINFTANQNRIQKTKKLK